MKLFSCFPASPHMSLVTCHSSLLLKDSRHMSPVPCHSPNNPMKTKTNPHQSEITDQRSEITRLPRLHSSLVTRHSSLLLGLFCFALFASSALAQIPVTVTNPTNTTPNLAASYTSLANALTDLNLVTAMTGPVTLTCTVGNSETAPIKGFVVGSATLDPVLSATNTITINKSGAGAVTINAGVGTALDGLLLPTACFI